MLICMCLLFLIINIKKKEKCHPIAFWVTFFEIVYIYTKDLFGVNRYIIPKKRDYLMSTLQTVSSALRRMLTPCCSDGWGRPMGS